MKILFSGYAKIVRRNEKPVYFGEVDLLVDGKRAGVRRLTSRPFRRANDAIDYAWAYVEAARKHLGKDVGQVVCPKCGKLMEPLHIELFDLRCWNQTCGLVSENDHLSMPDDSEKSEESSSPGLNGHPLREADQSAIPIDSENGRKSHSPRLEKDVKHG